MEALALTLFLSFLRLRSEICLATEYSERNMAYPTCLPP